jgi:hypothetical protein
MTEPDEFDLKAAETCPCVFPKTRLEGCKCGACMARPAVAAALRELDTVWRERLRVSTERKKELGQEIAALKHDIERHITIANNEANEVSKLRAQLAAKDAENRDLLQAVDGMIKDREYFEAVAFAKEAELAKLRPVYEAAKKASQERHYSAYMDALRELIMAVRQAEGEHGKEG